MSMAYQHVLNGEGTDSHVSFYLVRTHTHSGRHANTHTEIPYLCTQGGHASFVSVCFECPRRLHSTPNEEGSTVLTQFQKPE